MQRHTPKPHQCTCLKSWQGIEFETVELDSDGRLALTHECGEHAGDLCVHLLSAETTELVKTALAAG